MSSIDRKDRQLAPSRMELADRLEFLKGKFGSWRQFAAACGLSPNYFTSKLSRLRGGEQALFDPDATTAIVEACRERGLDVSYQWLWGHRGAEPPTDYLPKAAEGPPPVARKRAGTWRRHLGGDSELEFEFAAAELAGVPDDVLLLAAKHIGGFTGTPRERVQFSIKIARGALEAYRGA